MTLALVVLQAHFNMGNLYRQCAEFGRAIHRCAAAAATTAAMHGCTHSSSAVPAWPAAGHAQPAGHRWQSALLPGPCLPCSYDNVLSIDASHWRSLLNKAVVQVRHMCACVRWEAYNNNTINAAACLPVAAPGLASSPPSLLGRCHSKPNRLRCMPLVLQTCTGDKDQATFNLKLALKLSGTPLPAAAAGPLLATSGPHSEVMFQSRIASPCSLLPPTTLSRSLPPAPTLPLLGVAGQGGVLSQEVDQLKRMLKAGANWDVISQMMSYISDKAAQVGGLAGLAGGWAASGRAGQTLMAVALLATIKGLQTASAHYDV